MAAGTYMQSVMWCCTSCGFSLQFGQPKYECPLCEAYKSAFVDTPQHIERELTEKYGEGNTNAADARAERLSILRENGYLKNNRFRSRQLEAVYVTQTSRKTI